DDRPLTAQLLYVHQQLGNTDEARRYAARAIDQLDDAGTAGGQDESEQRFTLRRLHEDLGRRWRFGADLVLGDSTSSASNAIAPGVAYRSYFQAEVQYRFDPHLTGGDANTMAAYARVFAGSGRQGSLWPIHAPMLGVGLHWKPWLERMVVFTVEQQQPLDNHPDTRSDTMLRASASWYGNPRLSDDWHAMGSGWLAQNLYLDAAHYLHAKQTAFTVDYRLSFHRKLNGAQTIEPYVRLQFNGLDRSHGQGFGRDLRAGLGVRWNVWYGENRYDAYRHRFSVGLEWQHAFTSYLNESRAIYLTIGGQW
ncbi:NfrA family protein, partial [Frateuria defendens]|uniref:NfrA family protein n=1 Tax=Frateuria defendens TaxID=2219559 RepID=UPI00066FF142